MTRKAMGADPTEVPQVGTHLSGIVVSTSTSLPADVSTLVFAVKEPEDMEYGGTLKGATATLEKYQADMDTEFAMGAVAAQMKKTKYSGGYKKMESMTLIGASLAAASVISLGLSDEATAFGYIDVGKTLAGYFKKEQCTSAAIALPSGLSEGAAVAILEGVYEGMCPDHQVKFSKMELQEPVLKKLVFIVPGMDEKKFVELAKLAKVKVDARYFAAEMVEAPPNYCTPTTLAQAYKKLAKELKFKHVELGEEELVKMKAGGMLSVGRGSAYPPRIVRLTYEPEGCTADTPTIAFVGKGITMDTGGYNIKVDAGMQLIMKTDMGGSAAVMGAAKAIGQLKPKHLRVHFVAAIAENMIDKHAYRCGDVITMLDGKKVEVGHTDAEGRLVLADGIHYVSTLPASEGTPSVVLTAATLTGCALMSLGDLYASLFTRHHFLMKKMMESSVETGELMFPVPMVKQYEHFRTTHCGDVSSIHSTPYTKHILASLFLKSFCPKSTAYMHIDMAGQALDFGTRVATGYGPKALSTFTMKLDEALAKGGDIKKLAGKEEVACVLKLE